MNIPLKEIQPESAIWQSVCRKSLAKLLSELSYEEVLSPIYKDGKAELKLKSGVTYIFDATLGAWGNLLIDPASITRSNVQDTQEMSPLQFVIDARAEHGMSPDTEATFIRELSNTLKQDLLLENEFGQLTGDALIALPSHEIHAILEGHPKAVANKGRLGWGIDDVTNYAPESKNGFQTFWLAADRKFCEIGDSEESDETSLLTACLGQQGAKDILNAMAIQGISIATHTLIPVHPWQWDHVIQQAYIEDFALRRLIPLGLFGNKFAATPSLRTLVNLEQPSAPNIKLSLMILNTSAWRGIPGKYITCGGALSDWLTNIVNADALLSERVTVLRELRGIWYKHSTLSQIPNVPYQHVETLGAIWRETPEARLGDDTYATLMASLLHLDNTGTPLACAHAQKSGLSIEAWLERLFQVTSVPLYHFLCQYGIGFIAHGQNVTVVLRDHVPIGMAIKDLQGDVDLEDQDFSELNNLATNIKDTLPRKPAAHIIHDIQTAHFVTVLRFLSARLACCGAISEDLFYKILGNTLRAYMKNHPELSERFDIFDLFKPTLPRVIINKVRFTIGYGDNTDRPMPNLGTDLQNPLFRT
ncbi:IucA/IucC family siderophore biosynthesis protein [Amylibacter sp. SFDW26]|uniref:IucA/IucC family protein n=1 Tax=Amylibacter sp. SFDW26 TaxID=2652722 RepID=UPI001261DFA1|nr:IucA/IucC family protein [Amylibacter sp. SFDW26]KAB7615848.1 IucA/IucC family siderophore biosynthesis protein [Amylibacter sp. SFDW26]